MRLGESAIEDEDAWKPISGLAFGGVLLATLAILIIHGTSRDGWVPILDSANLALHEAGHPLVGIFSDRMMVYGGTLFQLIFPITVAFHFLRQREPAGFVIGLVWLGENLLNIARYMADARAQELPLVGGGEHDWTEIFMRWGVLVKDIKIAGLTRWIAYVLMLGALVWLWRRYKTQKNAEMI